MEYRDRYGPGFDPNRVPKLTGIYHVWRSYDQGPYYGPGYACRLCGEKNGGWNLWKEDFLPTCAGKGGDAAWTLPQYYRRED